MDSIVVMRYLELSLVYCTLWEWWITVKAYSQTASVISWGHRTARLKSYISKSRNKVRSKVKIGQFSWYQRKNKNENCILLSKALVTTLISYIFFHSECIHSVTVTILTIKNQSWWSTWKIITYILDNKRDPQYKMTRPSFQSITFYSKMPTSV